MKLIFARLIALCTVASAFADEGKLGPEFFRCRGKQDQSKRKKMKLRLLSVAGAALLGVTCQSWAGDIYLVGNPNSLITANRGDLEVIMALNQRHMRQAVRDMYHRLQAQGALFNFQPGARVEVTMYYDDGTAKIEWGNGAFRGFINKDDLTSYLGSNNPPNIPANNQPNVWANPQPLPAGIY